MDKDFTVSTVSGFPSVASVNKKPAYLITLLQDGASNKKNSFQKFIAIDKPDSQNGFIMAKGVFSDLSEEEIIKTFSEVLTSSPKELILDMWLPWHRVVSIRSLVFNANKLSTLVK
jgi:hypothetical protein